MKPIEEVIRNIESLYPTDSDYVGTNSVGEKLLQQAKENVGFFNDWRMLPESVLREYERLCIEEEQQQTKRFLQKQN